MLCSKVSKTQTGSPKLPWSLSRLSDHVMKDPLATLSIGIDAGRVKDLGYEVLSQDAPKRATWLIDVVLFASEDTTHFAIVWAIREDGSSFLDKCLVCKDMVEYEDEGAKPNTKGEVRVVLSMELPEVGLQIKKGFG